MADVNFPTVLYFPQAAPPRPFLNPVTGGALLVTMYTSLVEVHF